MTYIDGDISEPRHWTLAQKTGAQRAVDTLVDTSVHRLILAPTPRLIRRLLRVGGDR